MKDSYFVIEIYITKQIFIFSPSRITGSLFYFEKLLITLFEKARKEKEKEMVSTF